MPPHPTNQPDVSGQQSRGAFARMGISFAPSWELAIAEAIDDAMCCTHSSPDLLIAFISTAWSADYTAIISRLREATGASAFIGSSSSGVIAGATCHESAPGISILAMWLPGARLSPMRITNDPETWPWGAAVPVENVRGILLFSDPYRTDAQSALIGLRASCPGVPMIGSLASTTRTDRKSWIFLNDQVYTEGAVALALEGPYDLLTQVSQGGTPIGEMWTITSTHHNQILTISNRRAIDVMHETLDGISPFGYGAHDLMIGFPMNEYQDEFEREDFVARGVLGTDLTTGSIMIGGIPRQGQSLQFLLRDPELASDDLEYRLHTFRELERPIVGALLSSCKGRGTAMFGRNDHDAAAVADALPDVPMIGLYSLGELGPVRGVPAYNAFAAVIGLIVER